MSVPTRAEEVAALRAERAPKLARIEAVMNELLVKRPSRAEQAKKLGVHINTLRNREKRLELKMRVNGQL